ncbi:glutaredoxin [Sulfolobus sp. A20]|uniref:thioredoxin family protein n=1 Tax=Sulfolobaceae TaxID=118883 RepID=UPI000845DB79|nr:MULTISPECIES: thioredoxin family protein [unclassified Sulfolobus]TRM75451.1 glutaredoxin [Sulfolobus sp. E5]TRM77045.1 glutaredoxin [Sulfolobus sp. A20-N-F8]TRM79402.1 glutaredoxin [Sulfolobus sp. B5]TRM80591.1 glutaredoxin [Sulfolobus sp. D5]TRM83744.1 glutaredoxin [Sulfolobus sp. A20-N-F6]TRM84242.1 glutaredoxin [Sulfolobus sp. F3]TRM88454.1 glutaredoxin [Sulfolobus sp. C3]TRM98026.1 glutaredoxin [Sulfolobus sp. F1]
MSYDYIIKQYSSAIKPNVKILQCKGDDLFDNMKSFLNIEKLNNCEKPVVKVVKDSRTIFTYHGLPIVNELWPFLNALVRLSNDVIHLEEKELELAKQIRGNLKLFVTPDCTKCPITAEFLYQVAQVNENINLEIYDVTEYEDVKEKYRVLSVPKIIYNDKVEIPGTFPTLMILKMILKAHQ